MRANDRGVWCLVVQFKDQSNKQGGEMASEMVMASAVLVMEFSLLDTTSLRNSLKEYTDIREATILSSKKRLEQALRLVSCFYFMNCGVST